MRQVLIITAPFGFGPASKALQISEVLRHHATVTVIATGDAHRLMAAHAPAGVLCREGALSQIFSPDDMVAFDLIVCVDNAPAARQLSESGWGGKLVFVDDLLQWRAGVDELHNGVPILGYLVQDFPGVAEHLSRCNARNIALVAPTAAGGTMPAVSQGERSGVTLCLGGGTSPVLRWEAVRAVMERTMAVVWDFCRHRGLPLFVIGNARLGECAPDRADGLHVLGAVSPPRSHELIRNSALLVTTPGIGAATEAFGAETPVLLLPPTNSTQLQQFQVFCRHDIAHVLRRDARLDQLGAIGRLPWTQQAGGCVAWWQHHGEAVDDSVQAQAAALCADLKTDGVGRLATQLDRQAQFLRKLSRTDIQKPLLQLLNGDPLEAHDPPPTTAPVRASDASQPSRAIQFVRTRVGPVKRFCVVTPGRTGSTSLMRAIQAIDGVRVPAADIDCPHNELLVPEQLGAHMHAYEALTGQIIATPQALIEAFFERHREARFAGFKTMHNRHSDWKVFFARPDICFITLRRRDVASTVASLVVAIERQVWDREGGPYNEPWTFAPRHAQLVTKMAAHVLNGDRLLARIPSAIGLYYEELCLPGFRNDALDAFFGCHVSIERPQPPVSGSSYVTNWADFERFLRGCWDGLTRATQTR